MVPCGPDISVHPGKSECQRISDPREDKTPPEELRELKRLNDNYKTMMKSVRQHLRQEGIRLADTSELAMQQVAQEEEEHQQLMEYNRQENLRVAALREERVRKEHEAEITRVEASLVKQAQMAAAAEEEALRLINETQELVKTFIKREDLEQAIEAAMEDPTDYNFALDPDGHVFRGRNTRPEDVPKEEWEKLERAAQI
ncbi:putative 28S ribosomal protein S26, mitochondrial [Chionoecetes opilio]|uniref:Small ribosomal subunit protein mS26 n=1 Tax=Chionoecetes opilio TaxID=41210 RepID=A0A8J4YE23_CHIOP|nr:putative 28S ribosomal protein S26, mitochondrial [Chionoecetes opilio]